MIKKIIRSIKCAFGKHESNEKYNTEFPTKDFYSTCKHCDKRIYHIKVVTENKKLG